MKPRAYALLVINCQESIQEPRCPQICSVSRLDLPCYRIIHNLAEAGVHLAILGDNLVNVGQQQGVAKVPELPHGWIGKFVMDVVLHIFGPPRSYGMG